MIAVTVARKDGFDQAGPADGLERIGEGEEKGELKGGILSFGLECLGGWKQHFLSGKPERGGVGRKCRTLFWFYYI